MSFGEVVMKILIADDHALFRDGLSMHLEKIYPNALITQTGNFSQALKAVQANPETDLIIIDLDMPDMKWEEGLTQIKEASKKSKIVVISASEDNRSIKKALDIGICGYIPKRLETKVLTSAVKLIIDGGSYFPPSVLEHSSLSSQDKKRTKNKHLTNRQMEVLAYVAQGLSNKQIAYNMGVSEATVKLHINALLRTVGATNRTQAVIMAQKMGLI